MRHFWLLLPLFVLIPQTFGVNMTVDLGDHAYLKVVSDKNISSYLEKNLKDYEDINSRFEDGKYKTYIKVKWNGKEFIYNISPIKKLGNFSYNVESDAYLSVVESKVNNNTLIAKVEPNYKIIILGVSLFIIIPLISGLLVVGYIRKLTKNLPKSIRERAEVNKKIAIFSILHMLLCVLLFIPALFICDLPALVVYLLNFGDVASAMTIIIGIYAIMVFFPMIFGVKYLLKIHDVKNRKGASLEVVGVLILPMIVGFFVIFQLPSYLPDGFYNVLENLPIPMRIAFWMVVGFIAFYIPGRLIGNVIIKKKERESYHEKILKLVNELTKKLNAKKFKEIKIIEGDMANAMVVGLLNEKLILTTKLINILNEDELKAILAHEIAHKKKKHIKIWLFVWLILGVFIFSSINYILDAIKKVFGDYWLIGISIFTIGYLSLFAIDMYLSRKREKEADIIASQIMSPKTYIKALAKIHYANYMPEKGFLNIFSTHPSMLKRAEFVGEKFGISKEEIKKIIDDAYNEVEKKVS
ncbi:M48 family metallopeptidase [Methanotorris formicicus]|uniref:Peptidase M48 Ste24p n=1 Tax=Methanotorris formicicus Mc-S-70 TaxID=647171 RepID=H1KZM4_9EURY|nr:M56 family metallopeptidase [Methanotorris formicicus]EHP85765.1 peptidase M48 Ste24p [Methanotorris formicicus Mc-S-70]